MASTAAMCRCSVLRTQSQKMAQSSGKRRSCLSLDTWARQQPGTTPTSSSSGSSCTTEKGTNKSSSSEEQEACSSREELPRGCETPKSKKHRIPAVDVDLCPPAPKKPRASGRNARASKLTPKFGFSPGYLF